MNEMVAKKSKEVGCSYLILVEDRGGCSLFGIIITWRLCIVLKGRVTWGLRCARKIISIT